MHGIGISFGAPLQGSSSHVVHSRCERRCNKCLRIIFPKHMFPSLSYDKHVLGMSGVVPVYNALPSTSCLDACNFY